MAKLAGGSALRRWLCLFLIGSAAVCAAEERKPDTMWVKDGTTKRFRKAMCVVAIEMVFETRKLGWFKKIIQNAKEFFFRPYTLPKAVKNQGSGGPFFRMNCFANITKRKKLTKCQKAAEKPCEDAVYVYEAPERKREEMRDALRELPNRNVILFINCLEKSPDAISTTKSGKGWEESNCQGGKKMRFERSLVNFYPRIRVELHGDKEERKTTGPWYSGLLLARDLAQDGTTIEWTDSVSAKYTLPEEGSDASELQVLGIETSPGELPKLRLKKHYDSSSKNNQFKKMSSNLKIELSRRTEETEETDGTDKPARTEGTEANLLFREKREDGSLSTNGILPLLPQEKITVTSLLHQEMYPFLGAFEPQSSFFKKDNLLAHVEVQDKSENEILFEKKFLTAKLIRAECRSGDNPELLKKCLDSVDKKYKDGKEVDEESEDGKEVEGYYVSSKSTKVLKDTIYFILRSIEAGRLLKGEAKDLDGDDWRCIIEGPWQLAGPKEFQNPDHPIPLRQRFKQEPRKLMGFFSKRPKMPPGRLHLNFDLFFSYRDLSPSLVRYYGKKGDAKQCLGKFVLRFNASNFELRAKWKDVEGKQQISIINLNTSTQRVFLIHDLVGPEFWEDRKIPRQLGIPYEFPLDRLDELELHNVRPSRINWDCSFIIEKPDETAKTIDDLKKVRDGGSWLSIHKTQIFFEDIKILDLRSTQIYDVSPFL